MKEAITSNAYDLSLVGSLPQEIRELLVLNFNRVCISLVSRCCNQIAHVIAMSGYQLGMGDNGMLHVLVANDLAHVK